MMSSLDFRCELRIVNSGRLVRGKDACTNAKYWLACMWEFGLSRTCLRKCNECVCVCTVNAALAAVRIANVESFHDIHD